MVLFYGTAVHILSENYINRFGGVGRLYGKDALEAFSRAHVMVVGLGGVGSWVVETLARSGVGQFTLIDLDDICVTNTNRQLPAHEGNYGAMKAEVLRERVLCINPECVVRAEVAFYSERNAGELLALSPTVVVDAIDAVRAKCHLLASCQEREIPVLSCGGAGGKKDALRVEVADLAQTHGDKLISAVRRTLRTEYGFPSASEKPGKKSRKFKIPTVFSAEEMTAPQACSWEGESVEAGPMPRNLNCATGYGAVTHVTAAFGHVLAQLALTEIQAGSEAVRR